MHARNPTVFYLVLTMYSIWNEFTEKPYLRAVGNHNVRYWLPLIPVLSFQINCAISCSLFLFIVEFRKLSHSLRVWHCKINSLKIFWNYGVFLCLINCQIGLGISLWKKVFFQIFPVVKICVYLTYPQFFSNHSSCLQTS